MRWGISILFVIVLLAGCTDGQDAGIDDVPEDDQQDRLAQQYGAESTNNTEAASTAQDDVEGEAGQPLASESASKSAAIIARQDMFILTTDATPDGAMTGYTITIPDDAAVPTWYDSSRKEVMLEYAFLTDEPEQWALVIVDMDNGKVLQAYTKYPATSNFGFSATAGISGQYVVMTNSEGPDYLPPSDIADGQGIGLAFAAIGDQPVDLAIRFLDADPFSGQTYRRPAENAEQFLQNVTGKTWAPPAINTGNGLHMDLLYDQESLYLIPGAYQAVYGDMEYTQTLPRIGAPKPAESTVASVKGESGDGFTLALAWVWTEAHTGTVTYDLKARDGESKSESVALVPDPIVSSMVTSTVGDGNGPTEATLELTRVGAPTLFPKLEILNHLAFDVTLETLLGVEIEDGGASASSAERPHVDERGHITFR